MQVEKFREGCLKIPHSRSVLPMVSNDCYKLDFTESFMAGSLENQLSDLLISPTVFMRTVETVGLSELSDQAMAAVVFYTTHIFYFVCGLGLGGGQHRIIPLYFNNSTKMYLRNLSMVLTHCYS